jgi:hypothetical protein
VAPKLLGREIERNCSRFHFSEGGNMTLKMQPRRGIIKYGIAWLLGVPLSVLVVIFLISRGCG